MSRLSLCALLLAALCFSPSRASAQDPSQIPASESVTKSVTAVSYRVRGGATAVDLRGTALMPGASGEAKVDARQGATMIEAQVTGLAQPGALGAEFLTYVLWSVSTEGRTANLGELQIDREGAAKLKVTTLLQTFSLIVTAEPYFSVRYPSEIVVLENAARDDTKGTIFKVQEYHLMKRSQYQKLGNPLALVPDLKKVPLEMYEARNAVDIARSHGAEKDASDIFARAQQSLASAEKSFSAHADKKTIISMARQTAQFAEDARALASDRQEQARIDSARAEAAAKARAEAEAKAAADAAEAKRRADIEAQRQAELAAAREAQMKAEADAAAARAKAESDAAAAREAQIKAEADAAAARAQAEAAEAAAKAKAEADALRAREEAANAEAERQRKAAEELRAQLLDQFNRVLETRDTPRGLVVNMGDVLFDTAKFTLRPNAREILAKLSGIVLAHPGLHLSIEGYTDSTGSDDFNQKLSEDRANSVRQYLIQQGLADDGVSSQGFGKASPVADNATAAGRQKNRRVEIVVSGEVIGVKVGI